MPKIVEERIKPFAEGLKETRDVIKPLIAFHEKIAADAEGGGIKGFFAKKILAAEENPTTWVKHLVVGVCVAGVIAFGVIHLLRTGRGVGGELIDKLAAKHPENRRLQTLAAKVDAFEGHVSERLSALPLLAQLVKGAAVGAPAAGPPGMAAGRYAAALAPEAIHQLLAKLDALHNKVDNNTAVSTQAAQAAAVAANK